MHLGTHEIERFSLEGLECGSLRLATPGLRQTTPYDPAEEGEKKKGKSWLPRRGEHRTA